MLSATGALAATMNNDSIDFSGTVQTVDEKFTSATGFEVNVTGDKNVNNTTYDGMGGEVFLAMTDDADYLRSGATQNVEIFRACNEGDVLDLTDQFLDLTVIGGRGDDIAASGNGNNIVAGGVGNDWIDSGAGNDSVFGNENDDIIVFSAGLDQIQGNDDFDTVLFPEWAKISDILFGATSDASLLFSFDGFDPITEETFFVELQSNGTLFGRLRIETVEQFSIGANTYATVQNADGAVIGADFPDVPLAAGLPLLAGGMGLLMIACRRDVARYPGHT